MDNKVALIILDGWGIGSDPTRSAIAQASTPFYHQLIATYPNATLFTYGEYVGLPDGQMGNSEVGHINIGAGRIIYQELARINKAVREKELHQMPILLDAIRAAKERNAKIHLMGLVSDGGVHSHITHLLALCDILEAEGVTNSFIHAFTDGRDTDPKSGVSFIRILQNHIADQHVKLTTVVGRYFAMDRDNRWERVQKAYDLITKGIGNTTDDIIATMEEGYANGITDEFIDATILSNAKNGLIEEGDLVIFFNFRTDRPRELTKVLTQQSIDGYDMHPLNLDMITFTRYDQEFEGIDALFEKDAIENSLGQVISDSGKKQLRIAETEKYPHVTFFFSGGREQPYEGEGRILIPSPKVATYDLQPEMSAAGITEGLVKYVDEVAPDFICLNFANTDMVGHTGDFQAAIIAAETVDGCLKTIVDHCLPLGYKFIVIADHGNSDYMINDDGSPNTAHTLNPVPVIFAGEGVTKEEVTINSGVLADVAPTILNLMGIALPKEMKGANLISFE